MLTLSCRNGSQALKKKNIYKKIGPSLISERVCKKKIGLRFYSVEKPPTDKGFRSQYLSFDKESNNPRIQNVGRLSLSDVFKEDDENESMKNNWVNELADLNDIDKEIALDTIYVDYLDGRIQVDEELMKNWDKITLEEKEQRAVEMMKAFTPLPKRPSTESSEVLPWDEEDSLPGEETEGSVGLEDTSEYLKQNDQFFENWDENEGSFEQKLDFLSKMQDVPKNIVEKMNEDPTLVEEHIRASSLEQLGEDRLLKETLENPSDSFIEYENMIQDGTDKEFMQELMDLVEPDDDLTLEDLEINDRLSNQENKDRYDDVDEDDVDEDAYYINADNTSIPMDKFSFTWDVRDVNFKVKSFDLLPKEYLVSYFSRFSSELFGEIFLEEMDRTAIEDFLLKKLSLCRTFFSCLPREQLEHYMSLVPAQVSKDLRFIDLREDFQDFLNELTVKVADHILKEMTKKELLANITAIPIMNLLPLLRTIDRNTMEKGYMDTYPLIEDEEDLEDFASVIEVAPVEKARILMSRLSKEDLESVINVLDDAVVEQLYPGAEEKEDYVYDFDVSQTENMDILKEVIYMATNCHLSQKGQDLLLRSRTEEELPTVDDTDMLEPSTVEIIEEEDLTSIFDNVVLDAEDEKKIERLYAQVDFAYLELETNVDAVKDELSRLADDLYEKAPTVQTQSMLELVEESEPELVSEESSLDKMMKLKKEKEIIPENQKSRELNLGQLEDITGSQIRQYVESLSPTGVHFGNIDIQNPFISGQASTLLKNDVDFIDNAVNQTWDFESDVTPDHKITESDMALLKEMPLKEDGTVDTKALLKNTSLVKRIVESELSLDNTLKNTIIGNVKSILGPDNSKKLVASAEQAQGMDVDTFLKQKYDEGVIDEALLTSLSGLQDFFDTSQVEHLVNKIQENPSLKDNIFNSKAPLDDVKDINAESEKFDRMIKSVKQKILDMSYEDPKHIKKTLNLANKIEEVPLEPHQAQFIENEGTEFIEKEAADDTADMSPALEMGESFQEFDDESPVLERREKPKISDYDNSWDYLNALGIFDTEIMSIEDKQLDGIREIQNARSRLQKKRDFADQFMKQYPLYGEEMDNFALGMNKAPKCGAGACIFCSGENNNYPLEPMNVPLLLRFMNRYGFIKPKRITGLCSKMQRRVTKTIAQARNMGLFSYKYNRFEVLNPLVERDTPLYVDEEISYRVKELMNYKEDAKEIKRYLRWSTKPIVEKGITQKF